MDERKKWYDGIRDQESSSTSCHIGRIVDARYEILGVEDARTLYGRRIESKTVALIFGLELGDHGSNWCLPKVEQIEEFLGRMKSTNPKQLNGKYLDVYMDGFDVRGISVD